MMELYKKREDHPVAGCLPILVQIPFFLAFYWVLLGASRCARRRSWAGSNLSSRRSVLRAAGDGVAMFAQEKLNPMPPDPVQAKMTAFMPGS